MPDLVTHAFPPVWDAHSRILILGTMPSVKSREQQFYYMHPQNRFWKVLSALLQWEFPQTIDEKKQMLLRSRIALWDVLASCEIEGSADSTIRSPAANDFTPLLRGAPIRAVFTNGRKADKLYRKLSLPQTKLPAACLPSTSPANAAFTLPRLLAAWRAVPEALG